MPTVAVSSSRALHQCLAEKASYSWLYLHSGRAAMKSCNVRPLTWPNAVLPASSTHVRVYAVRISPPHIVYPPAGRGGGWCHVKQREDCSSQTWSRGTCFSDGASVYPTNHRLTTTTCFSLQLALPTGQLSWTFQTDPLIATQYCKNSLVIPIY